MIRATAGFQERGVLLALVVAVAVSWIISDTFVRRDNVAGILQDITFQGIMVIGVTIALIAGEIDISVGSVYGLTSVVTALLLQDGQPILVAVLIGLITGLACGLANGLLAWIIGIPAIIVTLATLGIYRGFAIGVSDGTSVSGLPPNEFFYSTLGNGFAFGDVTWLTLLFVALAIVVGIALARSILGFRVYSVGSNPTAARLIGMNVARVRISVLAFSGACAGLAGVLSVAYLSSASPTGGGGYELEVLAAVIIGGAKLSGGRGTILGAVIGLLIIGIVRNMLVLTGVPPAWQFAVSGTVLLVAVGLDRLAQGRREG